VKKLALLSATALISINLWTGFPLFAVWVGSKVQGNFGSPSMTAILVVVLVFAVLVFAAASALAWLNAEYDSLTGRRPPPRQVYPWLQSMRGERQTEIRRERGVSGAERVVVVAVVGCVLVFEIWFFFFAGSSLPAA
jgi:hypothetical protein